MKKGVLIHLFPGIDILYTETFIVDDRIVMDNGDGYSWDFVNSLLSLNEGVDGFTRNHLTRDMIDREQKKEPGKYSHESI